MLTQNGTSVRLAVKQERTRHKWWTGFPQTSLHHKYFVLSAKRSVLQGNFYHQRERRRCNSLLMPSLQMASDAAEGTARTRRRAAGDCARGRRCRRKSRGSPARTRSPTTRLSAANARSRQEKPRTQKTQGVGGAGRRRDAYPEPQLIALLHSADDHLPNEWAEDNLGIFRSVGTQC